MTFQFKSPCLFRKTLIKNTYSKYISNIEGSLEGRELKTFWSHARIFHSSNTPPVSYIKFNNCISFFPKPACMYLYFSSVFTFILPSYPFPISPVFFHPMPVLTLAFLNFPSILTTSMAVIDMRVFLLFFNANSIFFSSFLYFAAKVYLTETTGRRHVSPWLNCSISKILEKYVKEHISSAANIALQRGLDQN